MHSSFNQAGAVAYRARHCITLAGEGLSRGAELLRPLQVQDDMVLLTHGGRIHSVEKYSSFRPPAGVLVRDLGEVCLMPALINAHTHLQLSSLRADGPHSTLWGQGFAPWLRSLIPLLGTPLQPDDLAFALNSLRVSGVACVGDYTSYGLPAVHEALQTQGLDAVHFCECFGFSLHDSPYPLAVTDILPKYPALNSATLAPAGHALYSTHPQLLQQAHSYCQRHALPFSLHLAESPEEEQALVFGSGPLVELYAERILPSHWQAPGLRPVPAAARWGLLGPGTLAVHGVHCTRDDARQLASSGTALCLCPRSNVALGVGNAPVRMLMEEQVPLCLGTDGLTSAPTLDIWQDALLLRDQQQIPLPALIRLLTINGACCLNKFFFGSFEVGKSSAFALLPPLLYEHLA